MLRVQDSSRRQDATWWSVTPNGFGGDDFGTPALLKVRWEIRSETFVGQLDRKEFISSAVVFLGDDVSVGDFLCLDDHIGEADPTVLSGAHKIQKFDKFTDLRSVSTIRRAIL